MHTEVLIVACRDRLPRIEARGGIAGRSTEAATVHLISTAATPLGGDVIKVRVIVEPGARLRLRSVAATIALPGPQMKASQAYLDLEVGGHLDIDLEPTVVAADAEHRTAVTAAISDTGTLRLRERVQIGRTGERQGFWSGSMHADALGRALLRHRVEIGAGSLADDVLAAPRACVSELHYPADTFAAPMQPDTTVLELAAGGLLTAWQGERL
jgi:urease accessory protein